MERIKHIERIKESLKSIKAEEGNTTEEAFHDVMVNEIASIHAKLDAVLIILTK
jgi:hypothetical protein